MRNGSMFPANKLNNGKERECEFSSCTFLKVKRFDPVSRKVKGYLHNNGKGQVIKPA